MVFQFGVPQALFGVRRMLPLIWSKEPGVREAALNAYRQLYLSPKGDSARYVGFLVFVNLWGQLLMGFPNLSNDILEYSREILNSWVGLFQAQGGLLLGPAPSTYLT